VYTSRQIKLGNRRLLKLADYLETVPRGQYNQRMLSGNPQKGRVQCAYGHFQTTAAGRKLAEDSGCGEDYFALRKADDLSGSLDEWDIIFGMEGCRDKKGVVAKTGKQAAKSLRAFVKAREKELAHV
jgi:hypothetical protein